MIELKKFFWIKYFTGDSIDFITQNKNEPFMLFCNRGQALQYVGVQIFTDIIPGVEFVTYNFKILKVFYLHVTSSFNLRPSFLTWKIILRTKDIYITETDHGFVFIDVSSIMLTPAICN